MTKTDNNPDWSHGKGEISQYCVGTQIKIAGSGYGSNAGAMSLNTALQ